MAVPEEAATVSTKRRTPGIYLTPRPKGPNGEKLCYNCHGPMPSKDGRKFNCSPKCSEEWRCKTSPAHMRYVIEKRDKGICALCGEDTKALKRQYEEYKGAIKKSWAEIKITGTRDYERSWSERLEWLQQHGIPQSRESADWWDADHITPVIEGGGECGPENYRTLCIPCHQRETTALARRRAEERQRQKSIERDQARGLLEGL